MASKKFSNALNLLIEEKGLDKDTFLDMLKESIAKAYKKIYLNPEANVRVEINEKTGNFRLFEIRQVVDDLKDEDIEISLDEAKELNPNYKVGDIVETEAEVDNISRLAAVQTKQLFKQKIREAEKDTLYNEFVEKKDDIITGIVDRIEPKFTIVNLGKTGAFLASNQLIPGEELVEGQHLKVYVSDVDRNTKGTHIVVSRTDPNFVKRLFEIEVPEIYDGIVEIKSIAREAGDRTKMAVYCNDESIDAIGACVGAKGSRVRNVVAELNGEMIDIINWSDDYSVFIKNALSPSAVVSVKLAEDGKAATVIVPDDQLSLAIGKKGQNARLAVRLTGIKIDIKSVSEASDEDYFQEETVDLVPEVEKEIDSDLSLADQEEFLKAVDSIAIEEKEEEYIDEIIPGSLASLEEEKEIAEKKTTEVPETDETKEATTADEHLEEDLDDEDLDDEEFADYEDEYLDEDDEPEYDSKYDEEIDYDAYDEYYD